MRGARLALLVLLIMLFAPLSGCLGTDMAEWGKSNGEYNVKIDGDAVTIETQLGEGEDNTYEMTKMGCENDTDEPFYFNGQLSQFHHYLQGAGRPLEAFDLLKAVTTVVIVQTEIIPGDSATRVNVKDWADPAMNGKGSPLAPTTLGEPKLKDDKGFVTMGIIPATENVQAGMAALKWYEEVEFEGYFLESVADGEIRNEGLPKEANLLGCRVKGPGGDVMLLTKLTIGEDDTIISMDGEDDDEWVNGDVPILGRWVYILSLMAVGGGGAFGLFILSTTMQRKSAAAAAAMLLGKDRVMKAKAVKKDIQEAREEGLQIESLGKKKSGPKVAKVTDQDIKGFSLDNVLSSGPSLSENTMEMGGGGVIVTDEAVDMQEKMEDMSAEASSFVDGIIGGGGGHQSGPPGGGRQHFSSSASTSSEAPQRSSPPQRSTPPQREESQQRAPPRTRRAPPQQQAQPQEQPPQRRRKPSMADDDDFSNFDL